MRTAVQPPRRVNLFAGREHVVKGRSVWLVRLEGCTDRDAAEELRNHRRAFAATRAQSSARRASGAAGGGGTDAHGA